MPYVVNNGYVTVTVTAPTDGDASWLIEAIKTAVANLPKGLNTVTLKEQLASTWVEPSSSSSAAP